MKGGRGVEENKKEKEENDKKRKVILELLVNDTIRIKGNTH